MTAETRPGSSNGLVHEKRSTTSAGAPSSPLTDFLAAFEAGRLDAMEPLLHPDIVYTVVGLPAVESRRAVLAYWRRLFKGLERIEVAILRQIRDEDLFVSALKVAYLAEGRETLTTRSLVVFELQDGLIRLWADSLRASDLDPHTRALWMRLRKASW